MNAKKTRKAEEQPATLTRSEVTANYRARGRQIAIVITDEVALENLAALEEKHGGVKAAITALLRRQRP